MLRTPEYRRTLDAAAQWFAATPAARPGALSVIGHSRLVTNGLQGIDANNQPILRDDAVIVHNGIVVNVDNLWAGEAASGAAPRSQVDTEIIAVLLQKYLMAESDPKAALARVFADIYGETSIAAFTRDRDCLFVATNTGSVYVATPKTGPGFCFVSERHICEQLVEGPRAISGFEGGNIQQLRPGFGALVKLSDATLEIFPLKANGGVSAPSVAPMLATQRRIEDKAERNRDAQKGMRRCSACLLPQTMPFIVYDGQGVCNYCHNYKRWERGADIEEQLDRIRSRDGSPDCIVAFSGGRDSSYGLHLLKTKFGMTPITFSYDWGMVTDLARRNQARMCGKLGIEHIWISADIKSKRDNIRRNVLAWLKKPDLGMVPLFMAGDKQFFWYARETIRATGVGTSVFCTNRLEKTDFKTGFLGIKPADANKHNRPSSLGLAAKGELFYQYGSRFLSNPAYLNRSLADTMWAAVSYYGIEQNHLFLFDYVTWDEDEINDVLIGEYDWETAPDTPSTWRIGDGTAPLYNYIYWSVAGFTEFDTFRSNQIREGMMTRDRALLDLDDVNAPRWGAIREYAHLINVDFDEVIRVIDRMPKLYAAA